MDLVFIGRPMEHVFFVVVKLIRHWNELRRYSCSVCGFMVLSGFWLLLFYSVIYYCLFRLRFCLIHWWLHSTVSFILGLLSIVFYVLWSDCSISFCVFLISLQEWFFLDCCCLILHICHSRCQHHKNNKTNNLPPPHPLSLLLLSLPSYWNASLILHLLIHVLSIVLLDLRVLPPPHLGQFLEYLRVTLGRITMWSLSCIF